jgi:hypothetical protein
MLAEFLGPPMVAFHGEIAAAESVVLEVCASSRYVWKSRENPAAVLTPERVLCIK